jgi:uncharacterized LabA/DUF88 family protein
MKNIPIIIDGPNFINRILDLGIDKDLVSNQLILDGLRYSINCKLSENKRPLQIDIIEFVCSKKLFGYSHNKFLKEERDLLIKRMMSEKGVHVEEVVLPGSTEKGVDTTVSSLLETYSEKFDDIALISHDRDFVPVLKKLREKGKRIYLIALGEKFPDELKNEAYVTLKMDQEYRDFFSYFYSGHYINDDFNVEKFRALVALADDRQGNQLRVEKNGMVYFSCEHTGSQNIENVQFRYESLMAYNGYVGPKAASDKEYIHREYKDLIYGWKNGAKGYYDYPTEGSI